MSRTDDVVDGVKRMIMDGALRPGDRLPVEKELAASLGVSRSSLREGVRALSILGVLDPRQGAGTYVTSLDPSVLLAPVGFVVDLHGSGTAGAAGEAARRSALDFHAVRRVLETEAAGLAAERMGPVAVAGARAALADATAALSALGGPGVDHDRLMEADVAFHRVIATASGNPVLAALIESLAGRTVRARLWRGLTQQGADQRTHAEHGSILDALLVGDPAGARERMAAHLLGVEEFVRTVRDAPDGA